MDVSSFLYNPIARGDFKMRYGDVAYGKPTLCRVYLSGMTILLVRTGFISKTPLRGLYAASIPSTLTFLPSLSFSVLWHFSKICFAPSLSATKNVQYIEIRKGRRLF